MEVAPFPLFFPLAPERLWGLFLENILLRRPVLPFGLCLPCASPGSAQL